MTLSYERAGAGVGAVPSAARPPAFHAVKRGIDIVLSLLGLAVLSPVMFLIALLVRATSRGPALFRQQRIGLGGRPFSMVKFRTMVVGEDDQALREMIRLELAGEALPDADGSYKTAVDDKITFVGRWLRRTSIDELPQLVNVLRGEMSLVGPRPALPWEVEMFPAAYACRGEVRPGLTGLWQVSGRGRLSTLDMLRLDVDYVQRRSLWLDAQILLRTVGVIIRADGTR